MRSLVKEPVPLLVLHVAPLSLDVYTPAWETAAIFVPSDDTAIERQYPAPAFEPTVVMALHVKPPSVEVYMVPHEFCPATIFVPSDEEARATHEREPAPVHSVHVFPESVEV